MGAVISDTDFYAIILGSLPESYRPLLSSINAAARISQKVLTLYELVNVISEEYEHCQLMDNRPLKKGSNAALSASASTGKKHGNNSANTASQDITCYNCDRKGHYKADCWRSGGGKEGQRPRCGQRRGGNSQKQSANAATEPEQKDNYAFATSDLASVAKQLNVPVDHRGAIIDSGATSHFCPDREKFTNFVAIEPQAIHTADGTTINAVGRGDVKLELPLGNKRTTVTLKNALYVPQMAFTLIYSIAAGSQHRANIAKGKLTICELHRALGHVSQPAILDAVKKGLIEGVELDSTSQPEFCEACTQAKSLRQPFPAETKNRARTYGELVHTDLWGPAQTASMMGASYYISFTDDYSRETKVQFLKQKSEALTAFKQYEANLTRQHPGAKLRKLRSDRGGEYLSAEFDQYLKDQGIERQLTVHHSPQQNGVAERLNRTLVEHARAMLLARDMPKFLWAEAINYATWLKNRLPS